MSKVLSKVCVLSLLQLSLKVYEKAFSKQDIESRVGLTDLHVAQVLRTFQEMLKQRYLDGKKGLSDIQLGGHGTEFTHKSAVFEVEEQWIASAVAMVRPFYEMLHVAIFMLRFQLILTFFFLLFARQSHFNEAVYNKVLRECGVPTLYPPAASDAGPSEMSSTTIAAVDPNTRNAEQHAKTYKTWLQKMLLFKYGGVRISSTASTVINKNTPISVTATETIKCNTLPYLMFLSSLVALGVLKSVRADVTPTTVLKSKCNATTASSSGSTSSHLGDQPDWDVVTKEIVKRFVYERYDLSNLDIAFKHFECWDAVSTPYRRIGCVARGN